MREDWLTGILHAGSVVVGYFGAAVGNVARRIGPAFRPIVSAMRQLDVLWRAVRPAWFPALVAAAVLLGLNTWQGRGVLLTVADAPVRLASFLVTLAAFCLAIWYFSGVVLRFPEDQARATGEAREKFKRLKEWLPRLLGALPAAFTAYLYFEDLVAGSRSAGSLALGLISLGFAGGLVLFARWRRTVIQRMFGGWDRTLGWLVLWLLVAIAVFVAVTLPSQLGRIWLPAQLGTIAVVLVAASAWIAFVTTILVVPTRRFGLFPPLVLLLLVMPAVLGYFDLTNNHALTPHPTPVASEQISDRPTVQEYFSRWLRSRETATRGAPPYPVVVVAAEGGGIRSAYWTATLLARLEDRNPGFSCHVFALSGVSGGSLGAAVWVALLRDRLESSERPNCAIQRVALVNQRRAATASGELQRNARYVLDDDFLAPTTAGLLFPDVVQRFVPIPFLKLLGLPPLPDRQTYLEGAWENAWTGAVPTGPNRLAADFLDLWGSETTESHVPSLLLNATEVDRGRRSIISNVRIEPWLFTDADDTLARIGQSISLSTAAGLSARFAYVSPAAVVGDNARTVRLVDGGYFENSGARTAGDVMRAAFGQCLLEEEGVRRCAIEGDGTVERLEVRLRPMVLAIRNGSVEGEDEGSLTPLDRLLGEGLPPLKAVLQARVAHGEHDRSALLTSYAEGGLELVLPPPPSDGRLRAVPLGWVLSRDTQDYMDEMARDEVSRVEERLRSFLSGGM